MAITYAIRTKEQHIEALKEENKNLKQQVRDLLLLDEPGFFVDLKGVINIIHNKTLLISRADASFFYFFNRHNDRYELSLENNLNHELLAEIEDYIQRDPDGYIADEIQQFYIPQGFLLLPLSRRHKPLGLLGLKLNKNAPENITDLLPLLTHSAGVTLDNALMSEKMVQKLLALSNVFILGKEILSNLDLKILIKKFLHLCCDAVGMEVAALYLLDPSTGELQEPTIIDRKDQEFQINKLSKITTAIIAEVLATGKSIQVENLDNSDGYADEPFHFKGITQHTTLCLPFKVNEDLIGVLQFSNKFEGRLTTDDTELLKILINQMGFVLQNSRLFVSLQNGYLKTAETLGSMVENLFPCRRGHSRNVCAIAMILAQELGLDSFEKIHLQLAALLHDVGLHSMEVGFLNSAAPLTPEQVTIIRGHSVASCTILQPIEYLKPILPVIRAHHERFDGTGYPDGLKGEAIPKLARILAIADTFDALTHDRPHRPAMPLKRAWDEMRDNRGRHFDPDLLDFFLKLIENGRLEP